MDIIKREENDIAFNDSCRVWCDNDKCKQCEKNKQYTNYQCKAFQTRQSSHFFHSLGTDSCKKCNVCKRFSDKSCPVLLIDVNFFKRLIVSFGIKLRIGKDIDRAKMDLEKLSKAELSENTFFLISD